MKKTLICYKNLGTNCPKNIGKEFSLKEKWSYKKMLNYDFFKKKIVPGLTLGLGLLSIFKQNKKLPERYMSSKIQGIFYFSKNNVLGYRQHVPFPSNYESIIDQK